MKKNFVIFAFFVFSIFSVCAEDIFVDETSDLKFVAKLFIGKIEFEGIKYSLKRIKKEFPLKEGEAWNENSKEKALVFFADLQNKKILENKAVKIEETIDGDRADLKFYLTEQLSFFFFIFPFYSTTYLFKAKIKYWNFHFDGYEFPFETELEFIQKDRFNFAFRAPDKIKLTKDLFASFDFVAYTTMVNYLIKYEEKPLNSLWKNGIDSLFLKFYYKIPEYNVSLEPSLGFGYGNILTTDPTGDITKVDNEYHVLMVVPKLGFNIPLPSINSNLSGEVGFGFKNEYQVRNRRAEKFDKQEISVSLVPHNLKDIPKDIKDPLSCPININYNYTFPKVDIGFSSKINFGLRKSLQPDASGDYVDILLIQEYDKSVFEDTILGFNEIKNDKDLYNKFKKWYKFDDDNDKYILNDVSLEEKRVIWNTLTDPKIGFIYSNGVMFNPSFSFNFPFKNSGFSLSPSFSFGYTNKWQNDYAFNNSVSFSQGISFNYDIKIIDAVLNGGIDFSYDRSFTSVYEDYFSRIQDNFSLGRIEATFTKKIPLYGSYLDIQKVPDYLRKKSGHSFNIGVRFEDAPIVTNFLFKPDNFRFILQTQYGLYLPTYKESRFKMRMFLFGSFNKDNEKAGDENILGNWIRGKGYDYFGGFFGFVAVPAEFPGSHR
ncbi:MAG TPA: hypothetical protein PLO89_06380, partial [Spirochaetota bacterium]|nr:hypothetical protein [Spirochaetota bacterium]